MYQDQTKPVTQVLTVNRGEERLNAWLKYMESSSSGFEVLNIQTLYVGTPILYAFSVTYRIPAYDTDKAAEAVKKFGL